ncbi:MAG TPA: aminoglycoside phosphotransferase family protein [Chloroflexota bacterium]|nr:aminoglycoside phosphotransferase family protein [Chloroflexota bacterium]
MNHLHPDNGDRPSSILRFDMGQLALPNLDDGLRRRLVARFGGEVESWLDELPAVLATLADRWHVELGSLIPLGHMSVIGWCRTADGSPAVLKACPDRERLANEAAALRRWSTPHVPAVFAADVSVGALLLEAIVPGTMFLESATFPVPDVAQLLTSLHTTGIPDPSYPPLERHVAYLFDSWARHRKQQPELIEVVSPDLFERGRRLAFGLTAQTSPTVLLHGDLTAVNVLYGGDQRGLVAIDPAPCLGDPAFDAIDLVLGPGQSANLWHADDVDAITARAVALAPAIGVDATRILDWCIAFAGMQASELASEPNNSDVRIRTLLSLAHAIA